MNGSTSARGSNGIRKSFCEHSMKAIPFIMNARINYQGFAIGDQTRRAESSVEKRVEQALGIIKRGFDKDVEIECRAWHAVQDRGNPADHDIFHIMALK